MAISEAKEPAEMKVTEEKNECRNQTKIECTSEKITEQNRNLN
jgi:hypothetical protein